MLRRVQFFLSLLIAVVLMGGCGTQLPKTHSGLSSDQPQAKPRITAEYEESKAIIFSTGDVPLRPIFGRNVPIAKPLADERMAMYQAIAQAMPDLNYLVYADAFMKEDNQSVLDHVQAELVAPLKAKGIDIDAF